MTTYVRYFGFAKQDKNRKSMPTAKIRKNAPVASQPTESENGSGTRHGWLTQTAPMISDASVTTNILPSKIFAPHE